MGIEINTVILAGNLTRDPELRQTQNGASVCEFTLANNHTYVSNNEKKEEVSFINIIVWGKVAENCNKYLSKGKGAIVEGRITQQTWTTDDGNKRSRIKVIASKVTFTSKPGGDTPQTPKEASDNVSDDLNMDDLDFSGEQ